MLVMETGRKVCVAHLAFAPDGRSLAAAGAAGVFRWRALADAGRAELLNSPTWLDRVRFSADGRYLFTGRHELWRLEPGAPFATLRLWGGSNLLFDPSPTGPYVLVSQYLSAAGGGRTRLALWRADDLTPNGKVWEQDLAGYAQHAPQFLADGARFVCTESVSTTAAPFALIRLVTRDTLTGAVVRTDDVAEAFPYEALVAADGSRVALRGTNRITVFAVPPTEGPPVALNSGSRKHFTAMAFHPSGRFLAATNNDHTVKLLDLATGAEERTFTWQMGRMRSVCFSPDGALAAAGTDKGQVVVWDVDL